MDINTTCISDIRFWNELKQQGVAYPGTKDQTASVTKYTVANARKFLAEIYNVTFIPVPEYAAMSLWDSYPYGAAWYSQKPGYDYDKVRNSFESAYNSLFSSPEPKAHKVSL